MKNSIQNQSKIFKGAGWLLGISFAIVGGLLVFALSDNFAAAISAALPIGVFAGISLEQKFQREIEQIETKKTKMIISSLLFGSITFVGLYLILNL